MASYCPIRSSSDYILFAYKSSPYRGCGQIPKTKGTQEKPRLRKKIGECLVQAGLITETDLQAALVEHKKSGERLGSVLVRMNLATERQIAKALAYQLGFSYVNLAENPPDPSAVILIPKDVALKRTCVAIADRKS